MTIIVQTFWHTYFGNKTKHIVVICLRPFKGYGLAKGRKRDIENHREREIERGKEGEGERER